MGMHNTPSSIQTTRKPIQTTSLLKTNSPTYKSRNPKTTPSRVLSKNRTLYLIPNRRREQRNSLPPSPLSLPLPYFVQIDLRSLYDRPRSLEIQLANSLWRHIQWGGLSRVSSKSPPLAQIRPLARGCLTSETAQRQGPLVVKCSSRTLKKYKECSSLDEIAPLSSLSFYSASLGKILRRRRRRRRKIYQVASERVVSSFYSAFELVIFLSPPSFLSPRYR